MKLLKPLVFVCLGLSLGKDAFAALEVITVTATQKETSLQDIPIAVTALRSAELDKAAVKDVRDLAGLATSFNANSSNSESAGTSLRIRGLGTTGNNIGLESAVGVFIDGIYLSRPGVALTDLVDVERIEILRGPQGTLFGRNTSAGAISITTKKPSVDQSHFWANATFGNFATMSYQVGATFPLIDHELGIRFNAAKRVQDGFAQSVTSGNDSMTRDRYSLKGQVLWLVDDNTTFRVMADYADADEQCCDAAIIAESPVALAGLYGLAGLPADGGVAAFGQHAFEQRNTNGSISHNDSNQFGLSAQLNRSLAWADFTAILGYRGFDAATNLDNDYVSLAVVDTFDPRNGNQIDTWSIELRWQGSTNRLAWTLGTFYIDERINAVDTLRLGKDYSAYMSSALWFPLIIPELTAHFTPAQLGAMVVGADGTTLLDVINSTNPFDTFAGVPAEGAFAVNEYEQQGRSFSIYSHNTLAMTQQWDFVLGLRWTNDDKKGQFVQSDQQSQACLSTLDKIGAQRLPSNYAPLVAGLSCIPNIAPADRPEVPFASLFGGTFKDDQYTYTIKSVYHLNDLANLYASFTRGYKAGGFNFDPTAAVAGADPRFNSETTDAWELGYKGEFWQHRLRTNLAAFWQQVHGFQVLEFTGIQYKTYNVPKVLSSGFEAELLLSATDDLDLSLAFTVLDARYPSHCDGGDRSNEPVTRLCGNDLTNAPNLVMLFGFDYHQKLADSDLTFFFNGALRHESKRRTDTQAFDENGLASVNDWQNANSKTQLRMGLADSEGDWSIALWGNNIFDKQTRNVTFNIPLRPGARGAFFEPPRTYGVTLRVAF